MLFPVIRTINDVFPFVEGKPEFFVQKNDNGFTTIFYNLAGADSFADPVSRECRGIVFDARGNVAARPFHKFFNVNEIGATQQKDIPWKEIVRVEPKLDGSMIYFVPTEGKLWLPKTVKSFRSEQAMTIGNLPVARNGILNRLLENVGKSATAIFEYVSPENRVVVKYHETRLVLLAVRDNVSGEYWDRKMVMNVCSKADWPQEFTEPEANVPATDALLNLARQYKKLDIEGWVLVTNSGERYKIKTFPYHEIHRAIAHLEPVHILKAWASGHTDDLVAMLNGSGMEGKGKTVTVTVDRAMAEVRALAKEIVELTKRCSGPRTREFFKEAAMKYRSHPHFGLIMAELKGQEPDYTGTVLKRMLNEIAQKDAVERG